jgi:predicted esterase
LKEPGWSAWRAQSPARMLEDPARLARVKKELAGRIFLIVGSRDEFGLHAPTAAFDAQLTKLGVAHEFKTVDTGHDTANVQHALAFAIGVLNPSASAGK